MAHMGVSPNRGPREWEDEEDFLGNYGGRNLLPSIWTRIWPVFNRDYAPTVGEVEVYALKMRVL